jgi:hypothetical protein
VVPYLIIDEQTVASYDRSVVFHLNSAIKSPLNPVLRPGRPEDWDGLQVSWPGTVLYDEEAKLFRCWYAGMDVVQKPERKWNYGYAESADGVNWIKPMLGHVTQGGRPTNRVDFDGLEFLSTVVVNPSSEAPERRFVGLWLEMLNKTTGAFHKRLGYSADGMNWDWLGGPVALRDEIYDVSQLLVDPAERDPAKRVKAYGQARYWPSDGGLTRPTHWDPKHPLVRAIGYMHGGSLETIDESDDHLALVPESGIDDEVHFAAVQRVGNSYLMLFESDRFIVDPPNGDLRLALSSDGQHFRRVHPGTALVATGGRGSWDENLLVTSTAGMVEVGDEVWVYYFGCPNVYRAWPWTYSLSDDLRGSLFYPAYMGLATIARDRYGVATGPGSITTHPITIGGDGVWLNSESVGLRVAVVPDGSSPAVASGSANGERSRTVYRKVIWDAGVEPPPGVWRLRIDLPADGRIYSVMA